MNYMKKCPPVLLMLLWCNLINPNLERKNKNVKSILEDGLLKCACGFTSFEEILKAVDLDNDISIYEVDDFKTSLKDIAIKNNDIEYIDL